MKIGIVGGSLQGILLSIQLASDHEITVFELDAEIGTPAWHPGYILNPDLLNLFLTKEQRSFLMLKQCQDGWGMRWEWLMKHLTIVAAQRGVSLRTRTRIQQTTEDAGYIVVETSSNETSQPSTFTFDYLINTETLHQKPGSLKHTFQHSHTIEYPFEESVSWFGGILSDQHLPTAFPFAPKLILPRSDNLTELWWNTDNYWTPKEGYIEEIRISLPEDKSKISFDAMYQNTADFLQKFPRIGKKV
jgi:hypothetical protein